MKSPAVALQLNELITTEKIILFDGVCKLCNGWANFIIRHDKNQLFKLCSVQSQTGKALLSHFGYATESYSTMLYIEQGRCYAQSTAFLKIIRQLGYPWKLLNLFRFIPAGLRDWCYDHIALNRYRLFGRYDYCQLPHADHQERFIDD